MLEFDFSADGRLVVMSSTDDQGKPRLWVMPFDRSSPPIQIPNVEGSSPRFGPDNDIFFRHLDGTSLFVYRVQPNGSGLRRALPVPVFLLNAISPDGRWIVAWAPVGGNGQPSIQAFPVIGGTPTLIGNFGPPVNWSKDGRSLLIGGCLISLKPGETLPKFPPGGIRSDEISHFPGAHPTSAAALGPVADVYAFYKTTAQRNLYRIPIS